MTRLTTQRIRELFTLAGIYAKSTATKPELVKMLDTYLNRYKYAERYLRGLTPEEQREKKFDIRYYVLNERAGGKPHYEAVATDQGKKTRTSSYTEKWYSHFPDAHTLREKAAVSGVPLDILQRIDSKGRAAWRGGQHRPGAGQAMWGVARVNSFLVCGKTYRTADNKLAQEAHRRSPRARTHFRKMCGKNIK
jgi:hypothetical protein